jgi:hypothetical protein
LLFVVTFILKIDKLFLFIELNNLTDYYNWFAAPWTFSRLLALKKAYDLRLNGTAQKKKISFSKKKSIFFFFPLNAS